MQRSNFDPQLQSRFDPGFHYEALEIMATAQ